MAHTDDLMNKLNDVLNDEESMKQIKELASMLGAEEGSDAPPDISKLLTGAVGNAPASVPVQALPAQNPLGDIDISKLLQLKGAMQASAKSDKNVALLLALKPLLKEEKQARVDKVIKIMRLLSILPVLKDSGLLGGDLFGIL